MRIGARKNSGLIDTIKSIDCAVSGFTVPGGVQARARIRIQSKSRDSSMAAKVA